MTAVQYTARRSLIPGHSVSTAYSLDLACQDLGPARDPAVEASQSLNGRRETLRYFAVETYAVTTAPLAGAALLAVKEFLDSCEASEEFSWDPYGTVAAPLTPLTATLEKGGYGMTRALQTGLNGGSGDYFTISFTVRVLLP